MARALEIAVIDDDESFRVALVESLASLGYEAVGFVSAGEYVEGQQSKLFDCIVSDIHMPGISGWDLIKHVAAEGRRIPIILITGRSDRSFETKANIAGAVCLLRKPFEISDLIHYIEKSVQE